MPYFIYRIDSKKQLTYLDQNANYKTARDQARALRAESDQEADTKVKLVFANNRNEAERLLQTTREAPVIGDD